MPHFADDDPWIAKQGMNPKVLHALGGINIVWNACEHGLLGLFCASANIDGNLGLIFIHDLGDVTISNKIRDCLALRDFSDGEKALILNALDVYDVNRVNRNQLTHFTPFPDGGELRLFRKKGPVIMASADALPSDLTTIRRVADEITSLAKYLDRVSSYFLAKARKLPPGPLPHKSPLPEKLWTPPPPSQPKRKSPPPP